MLFSIKAERMVHTWCAVEVSDAEHIGSAADSGVVSACADIDGLAAHDCALAWDGRCQSGACTSKGDDNSGEMHVDELFGERKFGKMMWLCNEVVFEIELECFEGVIKEST